MSLYLHDIPLPEAQARFHSALEQAGLWRVLDAELILLDESALGRVLSESIWAKISSPHYHVSAMDGFASCSIMALQEFWAGGGNYCTAGQFTLSVEMICERAISLPFVSMAAT